MAGEYTGLFTSGLIRRLSTMAGEYTRLSTSGLIHRRLKLTEEQTQLSTPGNLFRDYPNGDWFSARGLLYTARRSSGLPKKPLANEVSTGQI